jgi:hypothetical protein
MPALSGGLSLEIDDAVPPQELGFDPLSRSPHLEIDVGRHDEQDAVPSALEADVEHPVIAKPHLRRSTDVENGIQCVRGHGPAPLTATMIGNRSFTTGSYRDTLSNARTVAPLGREAPPKGAARVWRTAKASTPAYSKRAP